MKKKKIEKINLELDFDTMHMPARMPDYLTASCGLKIMSKINELINYLNKEKD